MDIENKAFIGQEELSSLILHHIISYQSALWQNIIDDKFNVDDDRAAYTRSLLKI